MILLSNSLWLLLLQVPYEIVGRRSGDVDSVYADPKLAQHELNWKAEKGLKEMCKWLFAFICCITPYVLSLPLSISRLSNKRLHCS